MKISSHIKLAVLFTALTFVFASCIDRSDKSKETYMVYETHITLTGEDNMRDLGGLPGAEGKRILYHKLFRSGELSMLTDADLDTLKSLGIEQIVDLRTGEERTEAPDRVPEGTEAFHFPLLSDVGNGAGNMEELFRSVLQRQMTAQEMMLPFYGTIDSLKETNWASIFDLLESGKTSLWHCTAGKDRAGMTTALVLSSLGVERAVIIENYMATNSYLSAYIEQNVAQLDSAYGEGAGNALRPIFGVEEAYILAFFNAIDEQYGSMDAFLGRMGVDKAKMQANYLE